MSFLGNKSIIWFDGKFLSDQEAQISIASHTLHYGSGVFEGVRAYDTHRGPAIFRLEEHTHRFFNSGKLLGMDIPFNQHTINEAQKDVIRKNGRPNAYLRPLMFYGSGSLGVSPTDKSCIHIAILSWPWENYFKKSSGELTIKACVSSFRRHSVDSLFTKAKITGHYVNSILALQEAKKRNFHEAILLDRNGFIAEGSSANIFIVKNNILLTPTDINILPGITRATIIELANDLGITVIEKNLSRDTLYTADEVFFSGTASEISSVAMVDHIQIGEGKIGSVTQTIKDAYEKTIHGNNSKHLAWNTFV